MYSYHSTTNAHQALPRWQRAYDWAQKKGRYREFAKDELLPTRNGLLYCIQLGTIRFTGQHMDNAPGEKEESCVSFLGAGQPFELIPQPEIDLQAIAHVDGTAIFWLYWTDLEIFPGFWQDVMNAFRYQNQRHLLWLNNQRQLKASDRLLGYLSLMVNEFGEITPQGRTLPFALTHAQIASSIGTTRVTVTKLLKELRQQGSINISPDHQISLPLETSSKSQQRLRLVE
jgi:CRP-like cAMP-binding protein